jgi:hypothetical protein
MLYEKATRFGRVMPAAVGLSQKSLSTPVYQVINAKSAQIVAKDVGIGRAPRRMTLTPEQQRRQRFLRECRMKQLREFIALYAGKPRYFKIVSEWRKELIQLHEQA